MLLAGDWAEPNDLLSQATYLGRGGSLNWSNLSIHSSTDVDWIRFNLAATGGSGHEVGINFSHSGGDLDISLHDSAGNFLTSATSTTDNERISLNGRAAGTYYLKVYGYGGATNNYSFVMTGPALPAGTGDFAESNNTAFTAFTIPTIASATDPGFQMSGMNIHNTTDVDWYKFTLLNTGTSSHYVRINFTHSSGDLDMALYSASDTTNALRSSTSTSDQEQISLNNLSAGTYFLRVYGYNGATNSYSFRGFGPLAPSGDALEPNNSQAAARDLGSITTERIWDNLSITTGDVDWYKFQLVNTATSQHSVRLDFLHSQGDLDLELRDSNGNVLTSSTSVSNSESISLAGRAAGTYYVRVYGYNNATNPSYRMTISGPAAGIAADSREPNNSYAAANNLGTVQGEQTISDLTIHQANDDDWYRFTITAAGTSADYVRINFSHSAGDVDMGLYSSTNSTTALRSSTGTSDQEQISLDGLAAGTYYVRVYGYNGARSPNYTLTIKAPQPPAGDVFEPNDTRQTAKNLGQIRGQASYSNLSIHSTTDRDWFQFSTVAAGANGHFARIDFSHSQGDLDFRLYDSSGTLLTTSNGTSNSELISLAGRAAGTYYLEVFGYNSARNPNYTLTIEAPTGGGLAADNLETNNTFATATLLRTGSGTTLTGSQTVSNLTIHNSTDEDWFKFTTVAASTQAHSVRIQFLHANGDLELQLYNSSQQVLRSATSSNDNESLSLDGLAAGTYYLRVYGHNGATNSYSLTVDVPSGTTAPGQDQDAWTVLVYMTASDLFTPAFQDVNEMEDAVARLPGSVNVAVYWDQSSRGTTYATGNGTQSAWGGAGRAILRGDTNRSTVATTFELLGEQNTGNPATLTSFIQWAVQQAPAQRYALILWDHGGGLDGSNFDNYDGTTSDFLSIPETVTALTNAGRHFDVIGYDACLMGMAEIGYALRSFTDVFVGSEEVIPGAGYDYSTALNSLIQNPYQVTAEAFATGLVQSYQTQYQTQPQRWDTLSAVRTSQYNTFTTALQTFTTAAANATASDLTALRNARDGTLGYYESTFRDLGGFLRRVVNSNAATAIRNAAQGVLNAMNNLVFSRTNDQRSSSGVAIYMPPISGSIRSDYATNFSAFNNATGWRNFLQQLISGAAGRVAFQTDWAEDNDDFATSRSLGTLAGAGNTFGGLSLHDASDQDWFRFTLPATGAAGHSVIITPTNPADSVELTLYNATGGSLNQSAGAGVRTLSLQGLAAGDYFIKVFSVNGQIVTDYSLTVNAPGGSGADLAGDNSTQAKAYDLGTILQNAVFPGFQLEAGGTDWFQFGTPRVPVPVPAELRIQVAGNNPITAQLLNEQGDVIRSANGTGSLSLPYQQLGQAETYYLRILGNAAAPVSHSLTFDVGGTNLQFATAPVVVLPPVGGSSIPVSVVTVQPLARAVTGRVFAKKTKAGRKLYVRVAYSDNGETIREVVSPFQAPIYRAIQVTTLDDDGDGVPDTVVLSGKKGSRTFTRTF